MFHKKPFWFHFLAYPVLFKIANVYLILCCKVGSFVCIGSYELQVVHGETQPSHTLHAIFVKLYLNAHLGCEIFCLGTLMVVWLKEL